MGRLNWYKRDPKRALHGMRNLSLEERGAYNTVLDLIYAHDDRLVDDDFDMAHACRCDIRVWRRLKASLIAKQKISIKDGYIKDDVATSEVDAALGRVVQASEAGRTSARKRWGKSDTSTNENNDLSVTPVITPVVGSVMHNHNHNQKEEGIKNISVKMIDEHFARWWEQYPRKKAKGAARRAFDKALKKATVQELMAGAMRYSAERAGQDQKFTAHPATWLNNECWNDQQEANHGQRTLFGKEQPTGAIGDRTRTAMQNLRDRLGKGRGGP